MNIKKEKGISIHNIPSIKLKTLLFLTIFSLVYSFILVETNVVNTKGAINPANLFKQFLLVQDFMTNVLRKQELISKLSLSGAIWQKKT